MSARINRRSVQQDLFQPRPTRPTLGIFSPQVQEKTVNLLVKLLEASRNAKPNNEEARDER